MQKKCPQRSQKLTDIKKLLFMGIAACMIAATPMDSSAQRRYHRERYYDHQRHHHEPQG
jgi:hypothetical protein